MRWYSLLFSEEENGNLPLITSDEDLRGVDWFDLGCGQAVDNWNSDSWIASTTPEEDGEDGAAEDVLGVHLGIPTFSRELREALHRAKVAVRDIQYLPVHVYRSTGAEVFGFSFANIVACIEALDLKNSVGLNVDPDKIDPDTGKPSVRGVWAPALLGSRVRSHDIVRLREFQPPVFVSERFVEVFREGRFTGAEFDEVRVT